MTICYQVHFTKQYIIQDSINFNSTKHLLWVFTLKISNIFAIRLHQLNNFVKLLHHIYHFNYHHIGKPLAILPFLHYGFDSYLEYDANEYSSQIWTILLYQIINALITFSNQSHKDENEENTSLIKNEIIITIICF